MKVKIVRQQDHNTREITFEYEPNFKKERPMALDILLQAQETEIPELAYRYGCRNGLCGVCTIEVNGKSRLACRTKIREGDTLSALSALPVLKDLVVKRDQINKQLWGKIPQAHLEIGTVNHDAQYRDTLAYDSLNRCIECYACLNGCPCHAKNQTEEEYVYGNPYSFLRIQSVRVDPDSTSEEKRLALCLAKELGIEHYQNQKVPGCGVGIDLKKEVILPLLSAIEQSYQIVTESKTESKTERE